MKIKFNKLATKENMINFEKKLLAHLNFHNIEKKLVLDLKLGVIYFADALTHEEDTLILMLLGQHSDILDTRFSDYKTPE